MQDFYHTVIFLAEGQILAVFIGNTSENSAPSGE